MDNAVCNPARNILKAKEGNQEDIASLPGPTEDAPSETQAYAAMVSDPARPFLPAHRLSRSGRTHEASPRVPCLARPRSCPHRPHHRLPRRGTSRTGTRPRLAPHTSGTAQQRRAPVRCCDRGDGTDAMLAPCTTSADASVPVPAVRVHDGDEARLRGEPRGTAHQMAIRTRVPAGAGRGQGPNGLRIPSHAQRAGEDRPQCGCHARIMTDEHTFSGNLRGATAQSSGPLPRSVFERQYQASLYQSRRVGWVSTCTRGNVREADRSI